MKVVERKVAALVPHPLSHEIFGELPDNEIDDLRDDLEKRGLQHLIEVDIQGRVICGSQRLRAIQALGWKRIKVHLRDDLLDENDVREHLIKDNTNRRQLNPHQLYLAAVELERIYAEQANLHQRKGVRCSTEHMGRARNKAAADMDMSGAHFHRMKGIFESDNDEVKDAVASERMSVTAGYKAVSSNGRMRSQRPSAAKSESLRFQRFCAEADRFISFLDRHRPLELPRYTEEAKDKLEAVSEEIRRWE